MRLKAFDRMQNYFDGLEQRKADIFSKAQECEAQLEELDAAFEAAVVEGKPLDKIRADQGKGREKVEDLNRQAEILNRAAQGGPKVEGLAREVIAEARENAARLSTEYEAQAVKTLEARAAYLEEVARLGRIKKSVSGMGEQIRRANAFLPPPYEAPGLRSDVFPRIIMDAATVKRTYEHI